MGFSGGDMEYRNTYFQTNLKFLALSVRACAIQLTFFFFNRNTNFFYTDSDKVYFFKQFLHNKFFSNNKIGKVTVWSKLIFM